MRIDWLGKAWACTVAGRADAAMAISTALLQRVFDGERFIASVLLGWKSGPPGWLATLDTESVHGRAEPVAGCEPVSWQPDLKGASVDISITYCGA
jgi:hypothetical protein